MELNRFKQLLESTMGNVKPLVNEQTENIDINTIKNIIKTKGYKIEPVSGYLFRAHKETTGPIQNSKTGEFFWNYESYIPSQPGNQLWMDKRRKSNKGVESENIIINLKGPKHMIKYVKNGNTVKTETVDTQTAIDLINNYKSDF